IRTGLAGANAYDLFEVEDEDLAVADLPRIGGFFDGLDDAIEQVVLDRRLDLDLRQKIDDVFRAAIQLGMSFLPSEALDFGHGDALHADRRQSLADFVELERLDDCCD